jgi:hypothetical protein
VARNARRALGNRPGDGRLLDRLEETATLTHRLLAQALQRLAGTRVIGDGLVSLPKMNAVSSPPTRATHPDATLLVSAVPQVIAV